jgi:hypothetical protein
MDDLRGHHKDNDTKDGVLAQLTIDGVVYETDIAVNFGIQA